MLPANFFSKTIPSRGVLFHCAQELITMQDTIFLLPSYILPHPQHSLLFCPIPSTRYFSAPSPALATFLPHPQHSLLFCPIPSTRYFSAPSPALATFLPHPQHSLLFCPIPSTRYFSAPSPALATFLPHPQHSLLFCPIPSTRYFLLCSIFLCIPHLRGGI